MSLPHLARTHGGHWHRLLTVTDSLPSACTFEKMRSRNYGMLVSARRAAVYSLGRDILWFHQYVYSELNYSD